MSLACASLINYSSCVIEAFANSTAPSFVADDGGPYYAKPVPRIRVPVHASARAHTYIYLYAYARKLRDCIIAKSLIERQVSNAGKGQLQAYIRPIFSGHRGYARPVS